MRGRPKLSELDKKKNRCIRINDSMWSEIAEIGQGKFMHGLEDIVQVLRKLGHGRAEKGLDNTVELIEEIGMNGNEKMKRLLGM